MSWVPIYIRGREGFKEAVVEKLQMTWLRGSTDGEIDLLMFLLKEKGELRGLKKAIGSKLILKFRMHFIADLDIYLSHQNKRSDHFSDSENDLIFNAIKAQDIMLASRNAPLIIRDKTWPVQQS